MNYSLSPFSEQDIKNFFQQTLKNIASQILMLYYILYFNDQFIKLKAENKQINFNNGKDPF